MSPLEGGARREEMQCWQSLINVTCMRGRCHYFFCSDMRIIKGSLSFHLLRSGFPASISKSDL